MSCTNCGSPFHEIWDCKKPLRKVDGGAQVASEAAEGKSRVQKLGAKPPSSARESTAARMDVHGSVRMTPASAPQPEPQDRIGGLGNDPQVVILAAGTQAPPVDTKLGRPRDTGPSQGKSKRAAQMREYQRQRRANKKAKEAAK